MDTHPLWAEPVISTVGMVSEGDRVLWEDNYFLITHVLKTERGVRLTFSDGRSDLFAVYFVPAYPVAYQKRLE